MIMDHVKDYIIVQNLIPKQLCKSLIIECEKLKWIKHNWYDYGKDQIYPMKEKELEVLFSTPGQIQQLNKYLTKALKNYQNKFSLSGAIEHLSGIRFNRYKAGTKMGPHYDHIRSLFDGKLKGVPILSFVGLLNDNYEGGEFICRRNKIKLTRGDILLFPSNFMYPHEVKEVTKGMRFSFVCWAY